MAYARIVENVNMKAYAQGVRHQVYLLFDALLAGHRHGEFGGDTHWS